MSTNASQRETLKLPWSLLRAGGRHGLSDSETRDPIGLAVLALNKLASSDLIDRLGIRKASEQTVYRVTSAGFRTAGNVGRTFARAGKATRAARDAPPPGAGGPLAATGAGGLRAGTGPPAPPETNGRSSPTTSASI